MPAKAGIQGHLPNAPLDPRLRGCQEIARRVREGLHLGCACFETRPLGAPQHEFNPLMALRKILILSRPRSGRVEGRTTVIQPITDFPTASFRGVTGWTIDYFRT